MRKLLSLFVGAGLIGLFCAAGANADPTAAIPVGTIITKANCQKYLDHMVEVLGHECTSTAIQTSIPDDYKIEIEPTQSYPVPQTYWNATEKYSKQVSLQPTGDGSYRMVGFVAGMPFPFDKISMNDPLAGFKLMYDSYYQYQPAIMAFNGLHTMDVDRYGNQAGVIGMGVNFVVSHNTDPVYPMTIPNSPGEKGVYFINFTEQLFPTQIEYLQGLEWDFSDPDRLPETYTFIPSIRRVLRLSQAARCAPFTASVDFNYDDHSRIPLPPTWFQGQYLGLKNEITYVVPDNRIKAAADTKLWETHYGIWPLPVVGGHWEVRPWYQLEVKRIPRRARGYCEAKHYLWLDKEQTIDTDYDDFDQNGKFWRGQYNYNPAKKVPGGGYSFYSGAWAHLNPDFQSLHNSNLYPVLDGNFWFNQEVPAQYHNYERYGTPAGLQQVIQ